MGLTALIGGAVLTMDGERRVYDDGCVLVDGAHVAAVGRSSEVAVPPEAEVLDMRGKAVLPGFVNAHTHTAQILLRGGPSHGRSLYDWLINVLYPGLDVYTVEDVRAATRLAGIEAIRSGTTTLVDNVEVGHGNYERVARAAVDEFELLGLRVVYARMFTDAATEAWDALVSQTAELDPAVRHVSPFEPTDRVLTELELLVRSLDGALDGRFQVWPAPSIPLLVSPHGLRAARELAVRRGRRWTLHVAETTEERRAHGMSAVAYLDEQGVLGPELLAAHCVDVDASDVDLLRRRDVKVSVQPASNAYLASGIAPVVEMLRAPLTIAIGTDDANCNDSLGLIPDLKLLSHLQALATGDAAALSPEQALELATVGGARAIGLDAEIGSLEPGKRADVVAIDLRRPQLVPAWNVSAAIVLQAYGDEVDTVLVDGEILLRDGRLTRLTRDEELAAYADAAGRSRDIVRRAGLRA
jgi:atrazine chlorohydrolase/5-methylthioadenosine/S-adenosylhomocysteine deaminase/melamine deaminase